MLVLCLHRPHVVVSLTAARLFPVFRRYENILFVDNSPKAEVKIIDFGLSKKFGQGELTDGVGTYVL